MTSVSASTKSMDMSSCLNPGNSPCSSNAMAVSLTSKRGYGAFLLCDPRPQRLDGDGDGAGTGTGAVATPDGVSSKRSRGVSSEGMIGKNVGTLREGEVGPQPERRAQGEMR